MTIFCYLNQDNPSVYASYRTGCKRTVPRSLKTYKVETTDYHVWDAMLEKCHKLQSKPKTTDELKAIQQTIWEDVNIIILAIANFTKCLTSYMVVAADDGQFEYLQ